MCIVIANTCSTPDTSPKYLHKCKGYTIRLRGRVDLGNFYPLPLGRKFVFPPWFLEENFIIIIIFPHKSKFLVFSPSLKQFFSLFLSSKQVFFFFFFFFYLLPLWSKVFFPPLNMLKQILHMYTAGFSLSFFLKG